MWFQRLQHYDNMCFYRFHDFDDRITHYFWLPHTYKNSNTHVIFINNSIIYTREYLYVRRWYTKIDNINSILSKLFYFQCVLGFIKHHNFPPFEDDGIKQWHFNHVNLEKGGSIIEKSQKVFIKIIKGTYDLGEHINESLNIIKIPKLPENHLDTLLKSLLLYVMKSVVMQLS